MARKNRFADAASSALTALSCFALILGLLLTPNVVVAGAIPCIDCGGDCTDPSQCLTACSCTDSAVCTGRTYPDCAVAGGGANCTAGCTDCSCGEPGRTRTCGCVK